MTCMDLISDSFIAWALYGSVGYIASELLLGHIYNEIG